MNLFTQIRFIHSNGLFRNHVLTLLVILLTSSISQAQIVNQVVIGATSGVGTWSYGPLYRNTGNAGMLNYSRHAYIYTAAELNIPSGSKIVKCEWMKKDTGKVTGNNQFNVWMINTSNVSFPSTAQWGTLISGATQVYGSSTFSVATGANTYVAATFVDSFEYNGGGLQIMTDWGKLGYATAAVPFYVNTAAGKSLGIASATPMLTSSSLQSSIYGNSRPTIRITYVTVPPCVGTPSPGNTFSSVSSVCPGVPFTLSLQNPTIGGQVTYLWQSADNLAFTTNVTTISTSSTPTLTQTVNKYYRCKVTCNAGPATGTSTPIYVPMSPNYGCYCPSSAQSSADEDIFKFSFGNLQNCSDCSTLAAGPYSVPNLYSNYSYLAPAVVQAGSSVPFSIQIGECGFSSYPNRCAIFIDYNQNNSFSDPGELVYSSAGPTTGAHVESGIITIPTTALVGNTGLRVINVEQGAPFTDPCLIYPWGETEDYVVNILSSSACSGTPTPGNTIINQLGSCTPASSTFASCSGNSVTMSLQNTVSGTGITYQWFNNGTLISGATSPTYTTPALTNAQTYYCKVTCTNSGLFANSSPMNITMDSYLNCYCSSGAAGNTDEDIISFSINSSTNNSDCTNAAPGSGSILNQYSNFTTLGNLTSITLGSSIPFSVFVDDCDIPQAPYYSFGTSIWIDFNHNGSFSDVGEQVFLEQTALASPRTVAGNILIPCNALPGQTRIRVSIVEGLSGSLLTPCLNYGFGETEDYLINLIQPTTSCTIPIPLPGSTEASTTLLCDSSIVQLSLQNKCLLGNYSYQWFKNGVAILGATSYTYTTPKIFSTNSYYCTISCGTSSVSSTPISVVKSTITGVTLTASNSTYCSPGGTAIALNSSSTSALTYSYIPNTGLSSNTGNSVFATPSTSTTYTVIGTDAGGCSRTSTVTINATSCSTSFNIKLYLEGYYLSAGLMDHVLMNQGVSSNPLVTDSILVELHANTSPYNLVTSKMVELNTNGNALVNFPSVTGTYFIVIKHRNSIETWSAAPVSTSITSYDFTTSASQAYGSNQIMLAPGVYAFYAGDVNSDSNVDLMDLADVENDINQFNFGYLSSDINGDGNTDLLDASILENNISSFIFSIQP